MEEMFGRDRKNVIFNPKQEKKRSSYEVRSTVMMRLSNTQSLKELMRLSS